MSAPPPNISSEAQLDELKRLYVEDVETLLTLVFPNEPVKSKDVRLASVIVRRWLCDNELRHLVNGLGVTATVPVLEDQHVIKSVANDPEADYYLSGGVKFDGKPVWALYHSTADEPPPWVRQLKSPSTQLVKLGKAMNRPVLYFDGETFKMEEVLRFACNKLGGAHFDSTRKERERKLDAAAAYLTFGPPEETLPARLPGTIHLPLERSGTEVLSGIAVSVIVAATMMVNIHFDGDPLFEFREEP